jgi:hypothetical protein
MLSLEIVDFDTDTDFDLDKNNGSEIYVSLLLT